MTVLLGLQFREQLPPVVVDELDQLIASLQIGLRALPAALDALPHTTAYVTKLAAYVISATDDTVFANGTFTVTLPTAVGCGGQAFTIKNIGTGTITVATTAGQLIDGATTYVLATQYDAITVKSNGATWWIV